MKSKHIKNDVVPTNEEHKTRLRAQLLAHADDYVTKKKRLSLRYWPLAAIPVAALVLFVAANISRPHTKTDNPVQQVVSALTPQKVFALAAQQIDSQQALAPGMYYYTKTLDQSTNYDKNSPDPNDCLYSKQYNEIYTNKYGAPVRSAHYDKDGKLFSLNTEVDNEHVGYQPGAEFFSDDAIDKANQAPVSCPDQSPASSSTSPSSGLADRDAYLRSDEFKAYLDLASGIPLRQKEAMGILATVKDYTMSQNQRISDYDKPVIVITSGTGEGNSTYYFDQATKAYVGTDKHGRYHSIIVQQDVRALPTNDPKSYFQPTPMGR